MIMIDLNRALESAAATDAERDGGEPEAYVHSLRDRLLGFGHGRADAVRDGFENDRMTWPYPDAVKGVVPWTVIAQDVDDAGLTYFYDTPHGALWINSE